MFIAIEGVDGVGKTTVARLLAEQLQCEFVEKPFHLLLDTLPVEDAYGVITRQVNSCPVNVRAWFYGTGLMCLSEQYAGQNLITDRYLLSNYAWNSAEGNNVLFDVLVNQVRIPNMTVLLTAPPGIITQRIRGRNATDPDLTKVLDNQERLRKMRYFLQRYRIPSMEIDTSNCTPEQICRQIVHGVHQ